jgi:hypothetical protein
MTAINAPLVDQLIDWVDDQVTLAEFERELDMDYWRLTAGKRASYALGDERCGTTFCLAGKICDLAGVEWHDADAKITTPDGRLIDVGRYAAELLGGDLDEAFRLFYLPNDLARIKAELRRLRRKAEENADA